MDANGHEQNQQQNQQQPVPPTVEQQVLRVDRGMVQAINLPLGPMAGQGTMRLEVPTVQQGFVGRQPAQVVQHQPVVQRSQTQPVPAVVDNRNMYAGQHHVLTTSTSRGATPQQQAAAFQQAQMVPSTSAGPLPTISQQAPSTPRKREERIYMRNGDKNEYLLYVRGTNQEIVENALNNEEQNFAEKIGRSACVVHFVDGLKIEEYADNGVEQGTVLMPPKQRRLPTATTAPTTSPQKKQAVVMPAASSEATPIQMVPEAVSLPVPPHRLIKGRPAITSPQKVDVVPTDTVDAVPEAVEVMEKEHQADVTVDREVEDVFTAEKVEETDVTVDESLEAVVTAEEVQDITVEHDSPLAVKVDDISEPNSFAFSSPTEPNKVEMDNTPRLVQIGNLVPPEKPKKTRSSLTPKSSVSPRKEPMEPQPRKKLISPPLPPKVVVEAAETTPLEPSTLPDEGPTATVPERSVNRRGRKKKDQTVTAAGPAKPRPNPNDPKVRDERKQRELKKLQTNTLAALATDKAPREAKQHAAEALEMVISLGRRKKRESMEPSSSTPASKKRKTVRDPKSVEPDRTTDGHIAEVSSVSAAVLKRRKERQDKDVDATTSHTPVDKKRRNVEKKPDRQLEDDEPVAAEQQVEEVTEDVPAVEEEPILSPREPVFVKRRGRKGGKRGGQKGGGRPKTQARNQRPTTKKVPGMLMPKDEEQCVNSSTVSTNPSTSSSSKIIEEDKIHIQRLNKDSVPKEGRESPEEGKLDENRSLFASPPKGHVRRVVVASVEVEAETVGVKGSRQEPAEGNEVELAQGQNQEGESAEQNQDGAGEVGEEPGVTQEAPTLSAETVREDADVQEVQPEAERDQHEQAEQSNKKVPDQKMPDISPAPSDPRSSGSKLQPAKQQNPDKPQFPKMMVGGSGGKIVWRQVSPPRDGTPVVGEAEHQSRYFAPYFRVHDSKGKQNTKQDDDVEDLMDEDMFDEVDDGVPLVEVDPLAEPVDSVLVQRAAPAVVIVPSLIQFAEVEATMNLVPAPVPVPGQQSAAPSPVVVEPGAQQATPVAPEPVPSLATLSPAVVQPALHATSVAPEPVPAPVPAPGQQSATLPPAVVQPALQATPVAPEPVPSLVPAPGQQSATLSPAVVQPALQATPVAPEPVPSLVPAPGQQSAALSPAVVQPALHATSVAPEPVPAPVPAPGQQSAALSPAVVQPALQATPVAPEPVPSLVPAPGQQSAALSPAVVQPGALQATPVAPESVSAPVPAPEQQSATLSPVVVQRGALHVTTTSFAVHQAVPIVAQAPVPELVPAPGHQVAALSPAVVQPGAQQAAPASYAMQQAAQPGAQYGGPASVAVQQAAPLAAPAPFHVQPGAQYGGPAPVAVQQAVPLATSPPFHVHPGAQYGGPASIGVQQAVPLAAPAPFYVQPGAQYAGPASVAVQHNQSMFAPAPSHVRREAQQGAPREEQAIGNDPLMIAEELINVPMIRWTVRDVSEWVLRLTRCTYTAELFMREQIDGETLVESSLEEIRVKLGVKYGVYNKIKKAVGRILGRPPSPTPSCSQRHEERR